MATNNINIYILNVNGLGDTEKGFSVINGLKSNHLRLTLLQEVHSTTASEMVWERDFMDYNFFSIMVQVMLEVFVL